MVSHDESLARRFDRVLRLDEIASASDRQGAAAMIVLRLALQSLRNRWLTALLTVLAIAVSIALLLGVEKVRTGARQSFADTISGTDLIVGARSGSINLLLYSVFRIGNATNNITWASYQDIAARPEIAWIVPLSLGDSHRGFRVLGTTPDYFKHYKYRRAHGLTFAAGKPFADLFDAVIGADVAAALGYKVGDPIVVAHGLGTVVVRRARRQAVPRLRHPGEDRHAGRPHGAREPGGHRGDPRRLAERRARARASRSRPTRCASMDLEPEGHHGRADRPEVEARHLPPAARHQRVPRTSRCRRSCRAPRCRSCGASSARRRRR